MYKVKPWLVSIPKIKYFHLILHQTIPTFNDPRRTLEDIVGKGENAGNQHFLHFSTMFSTLP